MSHGNDAPVVTRKLHRGWSWTLPVKVLREDATTKALTPENITGYTGRLVVRRTRLAAGAPAIDVPFVVTAAAAGEGAFDIPVATSAVIACGETIADPASRYWHEAELYSPSGQVFGVSEGPFFVEADATR